MITVTEIFDQAKTLSAQDRKELAKLLIDSLDVPPPVAPPKTGAEIAAMVQSMEPIEFVDPQLDDPVEWVKAQRRKRPNQLKTYGSGEQ
ncbi:MAG: hypothetical protein H0T73_07720 [Ardenticatenales bacterium]|nr:hypothetical protein [Ardenticatenales bacterium]